MEKLRRTYLVQRLNEPMGGLFGMKDNPFSFGGGLVNGGLSKEFMDLVRPIFSFDYMGSAEFEFGAVPKSFQYIANNIKNYNTHELMIGKEKVFVICQNDVTTEVDEVIKQLAKNKIHTKESTNLDAALGLSKYYPREKCRTIGWLEIDNHFMFFTNEATFNKVAVLFGLKQETPAAPAQ